MKPTSTLLIATAMAATGMTATYASPSLNAIESATDGLYEPTTSGMHSNSYASQQALIHVEQSTDGLYESAPVHHGLRKVNIANMEVTHVRRHAARDSSLESVRVNLEDIDD